MKVKNIYKGSNPYVTRQNTMYDPADKTDAENFVKKLFSSEIKKLSNKDYTGFCVDIEFGRIVGLVRLGELAEDTDTVRVWCHRVPSAKSSIFGQKWTTEVSAEPLSTKIAEQLVYTCEQVERYGCPWSLKSRCFDFNHEAEHLNVFAI